MRRTNCNILVWLTVLTLSMACTAFPANTPVFSVVAESDETSTSIVIMDDTADDDTDNTIAIIDIFSKRGIGNINVTHLLGPYPETLLIRLHLQGLEHFRFASDAGALVGAMTSHQPSNVIQTVRTRDANTQESTTITPDSIYWMQITHHAEDDSAQEDESDPGYFEVVIPAVITNDKPKQFSIQWVDFYR